MSRKIRDYIREETNAIQQIQVAINDIMSEEKADKGTKQICRLLCLEAKLMTKTQEYLLAILSRIDEIGDADND